MNERTLIILTPGFPKDETDSTCLPDRQLLVKALKKNDPSLNIIVLAFQYPFNKKTYNWHGVTVISFNGRNKGKLKRVWLWIAVWRTLKKLKKENNIIGILNFWLGECALIGKYFGKANNIKQFTWLLGQDARKGNKYVGLVKPKPGELIALSDFIADEFFNNYKIKPKHIIPVGIDTVLFSEKTFKRTIDVLGAGSLIPLKQYDVFINVIKFLAGFYPDLTAVICGKGPEKEKLLKQIRTLGLEKNITLTGEITHREVLGLMQQSKFFLHTSSYEGFGAVCAEALYAGAHVVSFCRPMKEIPGHNYIVNTREEMGDRILELLNRNLDHSPVLQFPATEVAKRVIKLFDT
jgi:glycosyltransferase involved in cell wall biosynthesis